MLMPTRAGEDAFYESMQLILGAFKGTYFRDL